MGRKIFIEGTRWTDWLNLSGSALLDTKWHLLLFATENIDNSANSISAIISVLEEMHLTPVDWGEFPWIPLSRRKEVHYSYFVGHASFATLPDNLRPGIEAKIRDYFEGERLMTLFDVLMHPTEKFKHLGKEIDRDFAPGLRFELGLSELRSNILHRVPSERRRTELLIQLINHESI
jgi:hypothetical protein